MANFAKFLLALFLILPPCFGENGGELQLVQVIFRHGARNPILSDFPRNDPYRNVSFWPDGGYGQLTELGKQQHYALGRWLRSRYAHFFLRSPAHSHSSHSHVEAFVQSSAVLRAVQSADANLAGLFISPPNSTRPGRDPIWDKDANIYWQPIRPPGIPIHAPPPKWDNILQMSAPCPRLTKLNSDLISGPEMSEIYAQNRELFSYLETHSGKRMRTLLDVRSLYDVLEIEAMNNYTLADWTKGVFPGGPFLNLTSLSFRLYTWTEEMAKLKAGPLVHELIQNMQNKAEGRSRLAKRRKLYIYSGHDCTTMSLLNSLKVWNQRPPPYASAVILELRKFKGSFFVEMYYKNESRRDLPYLLTLPGCSFSCPLEKFVTLTKSVVPQNWKKECLGQDGDGDGDGWWRDYGENIVIGLGLILVVVLLCLIFWVIWTTE